LNKLATKIATVRRAEDITVHDATILSHTANPALDGIFRKDTMNKKFMFVALGYLLLLAALGFALDASIVAMIVHS
jgi:hypothetical protein